VSFLLFAAGVGLAAFATVQLAISTAALVVWRLASHGAGELSPHRRARALLALRLLPSGGAALIVSTCVLPAFSRFEPRAGEEPIGPWLVVMGTVAAVMLGVMLVRTLRTVLASRRLTRLWLANATPLHLDGLTIPAYRIDTLFPVAAIVGIVRPRLFLDNRLLESCSSAEIGAVVAHEAAHLRRWDNFKRLIVRCLPDMVFAREAASLERTWSDAVEEAADAAAVVETRRLDLADALIKVARLMPDRRRLELPASAFITSASIERRVRQLLDPPAGRALNAWGAAVAALTLAPVLLCVAVWSDPSVLRVVHETVEMLVQAASRG
jgi:Zn-dependent protease with chaperone function